MEPTACVFVCSLFTVPLLGIFIIPDYAKPVKKRNFSVPFDSGEKIRYNNSEERTTHTVSSSLWVYFCCGLCRKNSRHFAGVAAAFLSSCAFAFLEVFRTMIVTVHFLTWKVRRIRITSLRRDGANRLRVCMFSLHRPLVGDFYYTGLREACQEKEFFPYHLTAGKKYAIITVKSEPRTRLAPRGCSFTAAYAAKTAVTLQEWRLLFYSIFTKKIESSFSIQSLTGIVRYWVSLTRMTILSIPALMICRLHIEQDMASDSRALDLASRPTR